MKEVLSQLSAYHVWAHQQILEVILTLPEEKQHAEVPSSMNSLYKTVLHVWDSETAWWQRMKLNERIVVPSENFKGSMKDLANGLMQQAKQWDNWVSSASDLSLAHVFQYQNSKKEQYKQPTFQVLIHVFNHATYHRGQLINMLRQLGVEKLPATDFILWARKKRTGSNSSSFAFL